MTFKSFDAVNYDLKCATQKTAVSEASMPDLLVMPEFASKQTPSLVFWISERIPNNIIP
jgi:hypothetical protein